MKVVELLIDENEELAGGSAIALVNQPAHEEDFFQFNKEGKEIILTEEEQELALQQFSKVGEDHHEFMMKGYFIKSIEPLGHHINMGLINQKFAETNINARPLTDVLKDKSVMDYEDGTGRYKVRFKYAVRPGRPSILSTSRRFCKEMISANKTYRLEDINNVLNGFQQYGKTGENWGNCFFRFGGPNCGHVWVKVTYQEMFKDGKKIKDQIIEVESRDDAALIAGTNMNEKTRANPSPQTIRRAGLGQFAKEDMIIDVYGYRTKYFHMCPGAVATFKHLISMDNDEDTIGMIRSAAQVADNVFKIEEEVIKKDIATDIELKEATVLVDDFKDIINEIDKITGMVHDVNYMDGHIEVIKNYIKDEFAKGDIKLDDYPEAARENAKRVLKYLEESGNPNDCLTAVGRKRAVQLANGENLSEDTLNRMKSFLSRHAGNERAGGARSYDEGCGNLALDAWGGLEILPWVEKKLKQFEEFKFAQEQSKKQLLAGPILIPDKLIYRFDKNSQEEYYVFFSKSSCEMIAYKYLRDKNQSNVNVEHNPNNSLDDVSLVESWIITDPKNDKSNQYGYELPEGTWFGIVQVKDTNTFEKYVESGKTRGFSLEGYFESKLVKFHDTKNDTDVYILSEIEKLLKD